MRSISKFIFSVAIACSLLGAQVNAWASNADSNYPAKSVKMIVPFPPGGTTDLVARIVANGLTSKWGQSVVVENRSGASSIIGTSALASAPADGYTIGWLVAAHTMNPSLYQNLPYDSVKDFDPIVLAVSMPNVVVVNPSVPARNLQDLVSLAKKAPGSLNYASAGKGGATHVVAELFKNVAGVNVVHVPYKGGAPALNDLIGGQVQMMFASPGSAFPHIQSGNLRALAVTSLKRNAAFPDVPTVSESGYPGFEFNDWFGLAAPAGTSSSILEKIAADVSEVLQDEETRQRLTSQFGAEVSVKGPEEFSIDIKNEIEKWDAFFKKANISLN